MLIGIDASRAATIKRSGTENYSYYLIRALLSVDSRNEYALYFNQPPKDGALSAPNARWVVMPFPRLWTHVRLSWEMLRAAPDILFVPAHVLPIIHPQYSVVTVHDLGYLYYPAAHPGFTRLYLDWSTRYNVWAATHVIADSECTATDLSHHYEVPRQKITVVYPGVNSNIRPIEDGEIHRVVRAKYGIPGDYILSVGTLQPRKNWLRLIEAFVPLAGERENLFLVIGGRQGWLYQPIAERIQALGLEQRVILPGYVSEEDLPALLSGAVAFAFPSLYEGFGFPVLEAMACGTPVVCSNASSLPEVTGEAALTFDPLDAGAITAALVRILDDAALRAELIARGLERVRSFTWEKAARQVLEILSAIGERCI